MADLVLCDRYHVYGHICCTSLEAAFIDSLVLSNDLILVSELLLLTQGARGLVVGCFLFFQLVEIFSFLLISLISNFWVETFPFLTGVGISSYCSISVHNNSNGFREWLKESRSLD